MILKELSSTRRRLDGNPLECDCGWMGALAAVSNVTVACVNDEGSENDVGQLSCANEGKGEIDVRSGEKMSKFRGRQ